MHATDFANSTSGRLVRNLQGHHTFLPNNLPPDIHIPTQLLKEAETVANALGRLDGYASGMPDKQILIRSFVRREAQISSYIENTYARYEEVADAQKPERGRHIEEPVRETANAESAIMAGVEAVFDRGQPITLSLICQMHGLLLQGVRVEESRGRFRDVQVYIGKNHRGYEEARFVPPPSHLLTELMDQFIHYLCAGNPLPALVQIALLHYQFETIHPFEDGNGRLGRILILLGLYQHKLLTTPLLSTSLHFERNRQEYYDALLMVSTKGDWNRWVAYFIEGIGQAVSESAAKLRELTNLRNDYHRKIQAAHGSALQLKLVDHLFASPVITASEAAEILDVSYEAARLNVQKLVHFDILSVYRTGKPTHYVADTILKAVHAEPTRR